MISILFHDDIGIYATLLHEANVNLLLISLYSNNFFYKISIQPTQYAKKVRLAGPHRVKIITVLTGETRFIVVERASGM